MTQRHKISDEHELLSQVSEPHVVQEAIAGLPASNEAHRHKERIRAREALALCMRDSGLGG